MQNHWPKNPKQNQPKNTVKTGGKEGIKRTKKNLKLR